MEKFVSIIIPCRNEEKFIEKCLDSIIANGYPKDRLEILIGDGMSEDKTREIVRRYTQRYSFIKLFDNPKKIAPAAQNIGVKNAKGEIIMIMDAHVIYARDYILKCVKCLKEHEADNVGGVIITSPAEDTPISKAIVFCLSHFFGAGNSYFRIGSKRIREIESVPYGCYKREVFDKIGLYNENLARSYDMEFNLRLKKSGGKILLVPDIVCYYYPKSNLYDFWKHNFEDGVWVTYPLKWGIKIFSWRHLLPLFFVSAIIFSLVFSPFFWQARAVFNFIFGSYLLANLFFSLQISAKESFKEVRPRLAGGNPTSSDSGEARPLLTFLRYFSILPVVFACRHFAYGLGSLWGIVRILK